MRTTEVILIVIVLCFVLAVVIYAVTQFLGKQKANGNDGDGGRANPIVYPTPVRISDRLEAPVFRPVPIPQAQVADPSIFTRGGPYGVDQTTRHATEVNRAEPPPAYAQHRPAAQPEPSVYRATQRNVDRYEGGRVGVRFDTQTEQTQPERIRQEQVRPAPPPNDPYERDGRNAYRSESGEHARQERPNRVSAESDHRRPSVPQQSFPTQSGSAPVRYDLGTGHSRPSGPQQPPPYVQQHRPVDARQAQPERYTRPPQQQPSVPTNPVYDPYRGGPLVARHDPATRTQTDGRPMQTTLPPQQQPSVPTRTQTDGRPMQTTLPNSQYRGDPLNAESRTRVTSPVASNQQASPIVHAPDNRATPYNTPVSTVSPPQRAPPVSVPTASNQPPPASSSRRQVKATVYNTPVPTNNVASSSQTANQPPSSIVPRESHSAPPVPFASSSQTANLPRESHSAPHVPLASSSQTANQPPSSIVPRESHSAPHVPPNASSSRTANQPDAGNSGSGGDTTNRFVTLNDLTENEVDQIDIGIDTCSLTVNFSCLADAIERIKSVAPPGSSSNDVSYVILQFRKSDNNKGELTALEKAVRKSLKIHMNKEDETNNMCRLARFRFTDSRLGSKSPMVLHDYTPYVGEYAPIYNPFTHTVGGDVRCEWKSCYCETQMGSNKCKNLKYASILVPQKR